MSTHMPGLYGSTARFYDEFRLPYPTGLLDDLCQRASVSGAGRLLDLASGPGTVALPLSDRFAEVWAVDQEAESIEFAARKAEASGIHNVRWIIGRAEDVDPDQEFELVTIGTAFHWLDRPVVAERAMGWLRHGGYLALLWGPNPLVGPTTWQPAFNDTVLDWMNRVGATERARTYIDGHPDQSSHATVLEAGGFVVVGRYEFEMSHEWSLAALVGFVYSTSLLPPAVLGVKRSEFEADLGERLLAVEPAGRFTASAAFAYDLVRRPFDG